MEKFISLKELIKRAKKVGIDLGNGDPYNRLRYYTKMGWLPHMTRKANSKGKIEGHYPAWAMDSLKKIQDLKNTGLSNDQIAQKIKMQNNLKKFKLFFTEPGNQKRLILYSLVGLLVIILLSELNVLKIGRNKNYITPKNAVNNINYIIESGTGILPKGHNNTLVTTDNSIVTQKVSITFKTDYSPASRYWVSYPNDRTGFLVETDAPLANDAEFYWFVSN